MDDEELIKLCDDVKERTGWIGNLGMADDGLLHVMYTSDYLLEKLPAAITPAVDNKKVPLKDMNTYFLFVQRTPDGYAASYNVIGNTLKFLHFKNADTPLKALLKLTLALYESGELS